MNNAGTVYEEAQGQRGGKKTRVVRSVTGGGVQPSSYSYMKTKMGFGRWLKCDNPSSDSQYPRERLEFMTHAYNPSTGRQR